ncbi:MAG: hypothetical protein EWM72_01604 [Nitrospira sp.]|nr:MAG: hypothetical protein EWM72_01604 [Nitrospira sp.]
MQRTLLPFISTRMERSSEELVRLVPLALPELPSQAVCAPPELMRLDESNNLLVWYLNLPQLRIDRPGGPQFAFHQDDQSHHHQSQ